MASFQGIKSYKDLSKASVKFAANRGYELLVGTDYAINQFGYDIVTGYQIELWHADDNAELFLVSYTIQEDGSLYFNTKTLDIHKELSKVEDLPLIIKDDKQLREVIKYIADCLK